LAFDHKRTGIKDTANTGEGDCRVSRKDLARTKDLTTIHWIVVSPAGELHVSLLPVSHAP